MDLESIDDVCDIQLPPTLENANADPRPSVLQVRIKQDATQIHDPRPISKPYSIHHVLEWIEFMWI